MLRKLVGKAAAGLALIGCLRQDRFLTAQRDSTKVYEDVCDRKVYIALSCTRCTGRWVADP